MFLPLCIDLSYFTRLDGLAVDKVLPEGLLHTLDIGTVIHRRKADYTIHVEGISPAA